MAGKISFGRAVLLGGIIASMTLMWAGCTGSTIDKAAVMEVKKVAVVLYTVPMTIEYYDNPREKKKSALQIAAAIVTADNGRQAATLAHETFIDNLNKQGLSFKVMSKAEMMNNSAFLNLSNKIVAKQLEEEAKKAAEKKDDTASKVVGMLSMLGGGSASMQPVGRGPEGLPEFGLAPSWSSESALSGMAGEMDYVKGAIKALGVDAALIVNDPGMAFSCDACIGGTGAASTGSAFLATLVDSDGQPIMELRQWFATSSGSAVMTGYVVNPLQYEGLFKGHGEKMARVFADEYKDVLGK